MATAASSVGRPRVKSRRIKKTRVPTEIRLAREIDFPHLQLVNDRFEPCDIVNFSEDDQRTMVRSQNRRTIRRKPKIDELVTRGVLNAREAAACEWYAKAHALRYDTTGLIPNYGGASGRSGTNFDHLPKTRQQEEAYHNFEYARAGINRFILPMFERVVLYGRPLGKLALTFRLGARQLLERIEGRVQL